MTMRLWILFLISLVGVRAEPEKFTFVRPIMGTRFQIICHAGDRATAKAAADRAFAQAEKINAIASDYLPESELSQLRSIEPGKPIPLSPELHALFEHAMALAKFTDGAFDPTLGPLSTLWRATRDEKKLPDPQKLAAAKRATGWRHVVLDSAEPSIILKRPNMAFDLGGVGKGYAADLMLKSLVEDGLPRSMIAAGGDIRLGVAPPERKGWNVALRTFDRKQTDDIRVLAHAAVSTSGDLYQSVEIDGVTYSHILDSSTGLGLQKRIAATVIAEQAKFSDPLATAACVLDNPQTVISRHPMVREVIIHRPDEPQPPAK